MNECPRCNGFVIPGSIVCEDTWWAELRCVNCGWTKLLRARQSKSYKPYNPPVLTLGQY